MVEYDIWHRLSKGTLGSSYRTCDKYFDICFILQNWSICLIPMKIRYNISTAKVRHAVYLQKGCIHILIYYVLRKPFYMSAQSVVSSIITCVIRWAPKKLYASPRSLAWIFQTYINSYVTSNDILQIMVVMNKWELQFQQSKAYLVKYDVNNLYMFLLWCVM